MDLTSYVPTSLSLVRDRFNDAKRDPTSLVKVALETVSEVTDGKAVLVDATLPAVMMLEMAAALAANSVQENLVLLRKQYPAIAEDEEDLYLHMSDEDYLNRFAKPSTGTFILAFQLQGLLREMVYDSEEQAYKATIPRDTTITVDGLVFTTLYPIVLRRYEHGGVQISYDGEIINPVYALKNSIITPTVRQLGSSDPAVVNYDQWVFFEINALQVSVSPQYYVLDKTYTFKKEIVIADQFYHLRAFYKNEVTNGQWVETKVTHTDQVFDIGTPTVIAKVLSGSVVVEVPVIYLTTGKLSGELRVDVYTTKGEISINLRNYREESFVMNLVAIDEERDLDVYTEAMSNISYHAYSLETVVGGAPAITYDQLRTRVIYNTIGPQNLPITNVSLETEAENNGFEIVNNVDVLTNRVFLATRRLPTPSNKKLVTPANIGINTLVTSLEALSAHPSVINNGDRLTIKSKAVWISENGKLRLVSQAELNALYAMPQTAMILAINAAQYFYTPFHYVLDASGDEFEIRAYAMDQPYAEGLNFIRQNQTLQLFVNTGSYVMEKTLSGYVLRITTKSGAYYQNMDDNQIGVQLAFTPYGENTLAYLNGVQESINADQERTFRFDIETNHDFNTDGLLCITNSTVQGVSNYKAWVSLSTTISLLHHTNSITEAFLADETDALLGKFMLPPGSAGNSHEKLDLHFGDALSGLWRRSRSFLQDRVYRRYIENIPRLYETDEYSIDGVTGSIFSIVNDEIQYTILHHAGDPVLDADGEPVYWHEIGDVILDEENNPVYDVNSVTGREMDLLVVDGRYFFANDPATVAYRNEIETTLTGWITRDVVALQGRLLEQTRVFFYPKTTLGMIQVYTENNGEDYLSAEQAFAVTLYVKKSIYADADIRDTLRLTTVKLLDSYISQSTVNITEILEKLRGLYGSSVTAFQLSGLGGERNYQLIRVGSERNKLCLKKQLVAQADKTTIVQDAVTIEYKLAS